jgi:exopolysaccharide biosynthesis polyprenyl glycosylphosphotransferase
MTPVLPKADFLSFLRFEKRRVDRSKAPLSIAVFTVEQDPGGGNKEMEKLLGYLDKNTRETDIKGWVSPNSIGLILPDTDKKGVNSLVKKVADSNEEINYSVLSGTYPVDIFSRLLSEDEDAADASPLDMDDHLESRRLRRILKRVMDIVGSCLGLLLFSPLMALTAIAIKMTSRGPAVFKQVRLGQSGGRFSFYKFRSMYWNVNDEIHREYVSDLINGHHEKINQGEVKKPLYKMKSDPRVTRIGKIIRKTSIDEFPQLLNVLKGEMSLVGPRPPLPYEVQKYKPWHLRRILEVKPGITGLWQVDGRSKTSFDDMVRLDLRYAQHWSLWLDIKILLKTLRAVLHPSGAV